VVDQRLLRAFCLVKRGIGCLCLCLAGVAARSLWSCASPPARSAAEHVWELLKRTYIIIWRSSIVVLVINRGLAAGHRRGLVR
jgi:hypothetical protein